MVSYLCSRYSHLEHFNSLTYLGDAYSDMDINCMEKYLENIVHSLQQLVLVSNIKECTSVRPLDHISSHLMCNKLKIILKDQV